METKEVLRLVEDAEVAVLGVIEVGVPGEHQIKSSLETAEQHEMLVAKVAENIVEIPASNRNTAVCIDGRPAACCGNDLTVGGELPQAVKRPGVYAKLAGGEYHAATLASVGAGMPASDYNEAFEATASVLSAVGRVDSLHTSVTAYKDEKGTECAARDKIADALQDAVGMEYARAQEGIANPIADTLAVLWGYESGNDLAKNSESYKRVVANYGQLFASDSRFFDTFNPTQQRDKLLEADPTHVEILQSEATHPTHLHEEQAIVVITRPGVTLDRDSMAAGEDGMQAFCYNRDEAETLANLVAGGLGEKSDALMAIDFYTLAVAQKICAPGMPVVLVR